MISDSASWSPPAGRCAQAPFKVTQTYNKGVWQAELSTYIDHRGDV